MSKNLGVTIEVFNKLSNRQKNIVKKASFKNKDMVFVHKRGRPKTHAQTLGWNKYSIINFKEGYILIKK